MLDKAGCVSGRQLFALARWPAEAAAPQTQTLRLTPATRREGPVGLRARGRTAETGRGAGEAVLDGIRLQ